MSKEKKKTVWNRFAEHVDVHWFIPAYSSDIATCAVCGKQTRKEYGAIFGAGSYLCTTCATKKVEEESA